MRRIVILGLLLAVFVPSVKAQNTESMPSMEEIKAVNDSILVEAYQLYLHEKVAWIFEDVFHESQSSAIGDVEGWAPFTDDGITVRGIFFNKEKTKALFEASVNIQTGEISSTDSVRNSFSFYGYKEYVC